MRSSSLASGQRLRRLKSSKAFSFPVPAVTAQTPFSLRQHGTFYLLVVFSLCERKNDQQKEGTVPLRIPSSVGLRKCCNLKGVDPRPDRVPDRSIVGSRLGVPPAPRRR